MTYLLAGHIPSSTISQTLPKSWKLERLAAIRVAPEACTGSNDPNWGLCGGRGGLRGSLLGGLHREQRTKLWGVARLFWDGTSGSNEERRCLLY